MNITEGLDYLEKKIKSSGAEQWDIVGSESESLSVELFERKIKNTEISKSIGIGIRLFKNSRPGYSYAERISEESLDRALSGALENASLTDPLELELPKSEKLPDIALDEYDPEIESIDINRLKTISLEIEDTARDLTSELENVPYLGAGKSSGFFEIRNSNGVQYNKKSGALSAGIGALLARGESKKMGVCSNGARRTNEINLRKIAENAIERGSGLLEAEPVASGKYAIIFRNRIAGQIFSMFSSVFYAESAQKGQSRLQGKLGATIASGNLHLTSDPFRKDLPGSRLFDTEGVISQKVPVIEHGIFNSFLYNLESSRKDGVAPTGNGSRGYSGKASTSFGNLIVASDIHSLEDLKNSESTVLLIEKLEGGAGCSAISGEISIGAQGFLIENGKINRPVDRITLAGNFFDMLKSIRAISNEYSDSFSSVKVPDLLVDGFHVAG